MNPDPNQSNFFRDYCDSIHHAMLAAETTDQSGKLIPTEEAIKKLCECSHGIFEAGRKQYICGNGASAAFASHMALDWTKNGGVPTVSFNDPALLTAMGNDLGYEKAFSAPLSWYAKSGDLLITVSSSGASPNILETIQTARSKGLGVITISSLKPDNPSRSLGDFNVFVPAHSYGIAESSHQILLHVWLDRYIETYQQGKDRRQRQI